MIIKLSCSIQLTLFKESFIKVFSLLHEKLRLILLPTLIYPISQFVSNCSVYPASKSLMTIRHCSLFISSNFGVHQIHPASRSPKVLLRFFCSVAFIFPRTLYPINHKEFCRCYSKNLTIKKNQRKFISRAFEDLYLCQGQIWAILEPCDRTEFCSSLQGAPSKQLFFLLRAGLEPKAQVF